MNTTDTPNQPPPEMSAQDIYLTKMLLIANTLLAGGELHKATPLGPEAQTEAMLGGFALAEMFVEMHEKLSTGSASPTAWQMDRQLMVTQDGVPASTLHEELKGQIEYAVMQMIRTFEALGKKTGAKLSAELGRLMVLNGRLTAESVRIAVAHRMNAQQLTGGAPELLVKNAHVDRKTGRSSDQES